MNVVTKIFSKVGKDWLVFLVACIVVVFIGYFGFSFFSMTLKVVLLWIFIAFGCGTVIYHLLNPKSAKKPRNEKRRTDAEIQKLYEKKRLAAEKLQELQNSMIQNYKENILLPREAAKKEKEEQKFYHFNPVFRGKGQKLGNEHDDETELSSDQLMEQINEIYDEILDYDNEGNNTNNTEPCSDCSSQHEGFQSMAHSNASCLHGTTDVNSSSTNTEETDDTLNNETEQIKPVKVEETSLRQRKTPQHNNSEVPKEKAQMLQDEPPITEGEVITLAFRCPDGKLSKRRFRKQSKMKDVLTYVLSLGYSTQRFGLFSTFPRTLFGDSDKSLDELGITRDTSLIIDEL